MKFRSCSVVAILSKMSSATQEGGEGGCCPTLVQRNSALICKGITHSFADRVNVELAREGDSNSWPGSVTAIGAGGGQCFEVSGDLLRFPGDKASNGVVKIPFRNHMHAVSQCGFKAPDKLMLALGARFKE